MDIKNSEISEQEKIDELEKVTNDRKDHLLEISAGSLLGVASERTELKCKGPFRTKPQYFKSLKLGFYF